jgi:alpha-beta hydrolase superfamily lysophospholipase
MPKIQTSDGVNLYYEEAGTGTPIVFVHEFAGDYRTWEPQMRRFSRAYRCVTYSQRGYPPSDIPDDAARYGQDFARSDVIALMDALKIDKAHVFGHSMGAYTALHVGQASATLHFGDRGRMRLGLATRSGRPRGDAGTSRRNLENVHGEKHGSRGRALHR